MRWRMSNNHAGRAESTRALRPVSAAPREIAARRPATLDSQTIFRTPAKNTEISQLKSSARYAGCYLAASQFFVVSKTGVQARSKGRRFMWHSLARKSFPRTSRRSSQSVRACKSRLTRPAVESLEARNLLAAGYLEMNLVSNQAGAALLQDPNLNLPWGIAVAPAGGDFFISETGNGKVTLYGGDVNGSPLTENPLVVSIPGGFPTADVFNNSAARPISRSAATMAAARRNSSSHRSTEKS